MTLVNHRIEEAREQLATVYELMTVEGRPGLQQVSFAENAFEHLAYLLELLPDNDATEFVFRLSNEQPAIKIAELYNVLIWSADARGIIDPEEIQEWFYGKIKRKVEIVSQVDVFPSNSMEESERVIEHLLKRYPDLKHLLKPLLAEVAGRMREEKAWSDYRRDTFEMPKEMTPSIMNIIEKIKS